MTVRPGANGIVEARCAACGGGPTGRRRGDGERRPIRYESKRGTFVEGRTSDVVVLGEGRGRGCLVLYEMSDGGEKWMHRTCLATA